MMPQPGSAAQKLKRDTGFQPVLAAFELQNSLTATILQEIYAVGTGWKQCHDEAF
jgi:hypothetical protein